MSKPRWQPIKLSAGTERVLDQAQEPRSGGLLTPEQRSKMIENGCNREKDHKPVVKLFTPDAQCTWLLTELDPEEPDIAFGLCDLGMQCPELGSVRISELESVRGQLGLPIERDLYFEPDKTLSEYADDARAKGYIDA